MLKRRHVLELVKTAVIADFGDEELRIAVFELLERAALLPTVFADLVENCGPSQALIPRYSELLRLR